jgi:hypothetical protein
MTTAADVEEDTNRDGPLARTTHGQGDLRHKVPARLHEPGSWGAANVAVSWKVRPFASPSPVSIVFPPKRLSTPPRPAAPV